LSAANPAVFIGQNAGLEIYLMKKLPLVVCAFGVFFFANLGIPPNAEIYFNSPSEADVCDCGSICMVHVSCDVPKCNGRIAHENEEDTSNVSGDDWDESL
jgi:hypothetical protein